jgi:hypothetical protein
MRTAVDDSSRDFATFCRAMFFQRTQLRTLVSGTRCGCDASGPRRHILANAPHPGENPKDGGTGRVKHFDLPAVVALDEVRFAFVEPPASAHFRFR